MAFTAAAITAATNVFQKTIDDQFLKTIHVGPLVAADLGSNVGYILAVLPEDCDVVQITFRVRDEFASGETFQFVAAASGTAIGSGSAITAAQDGDGGTVDTTYIVPLTGNNTKLAAGTAIGVLMTGSASLAVGFCVQITYRPRPFRRADGSAAGDGLGNYLQG